MKEYMNRMHVQGKQFALYATLILLATIITTWNVYSIVRIDAQANDMRQQSIKLDAMNQGRIAYLQEIVAEKDYLLSGDTRYLDHHEAANALVDLFLRNAILDATEVEDRTLFYNMQRENQDYNQTYDQVVSTYQSGDVEMATQLSQDQSNASMSRVHAAMEQSLEGTTSGVESEGRQANRAAIISLVVGGAGLAIFVVLTVLAVGIAVRLIGQPIFTMMDALADVASGSFDPDQLAELVTRQDEVGRMARGITDMAEAAHQRQAALRTRLEALRTQVAESEGRG